MRRATGGLSGITNGTDGTQMQADNARRSVCGRCAMNGGLMLVKKAPQRCVAEEFGVLREGSTGRVVAMLPQVWAVAETEAETEVPGVPQLVAEAPAGSRPKVEMAFYRKYTQAMLRKYLRMSMEAGRVPSLLGRELFRGHVSSYRLNSFEDVVVFCMDVERCLARLNPEEKELIRRVALQEYTQSEAAAVMGMSLRCVSRAYGATLDKLTTMFLRGHLLEELKSCQ
ncbi:MAG TPA: sigma factor-like helix-turn-helix DNA-binding protein [Acidobacteriaceae bacterium]|nr:sigma factor-like helix-turn-helix DNA-binding protein [Acidobacteriaceae bacterium]